MPVRLFHVSEAPDIKRFEPRIPPNDSGGVSEPVVWAVEEERLYNYLLPRDCPRVSFFVAARTDLTKARLLLNGTAARAVLAIENAWLERVRATKIFLYELPSEHFDRLDFSAGYWVSRRSVEPIGVRLVEDCLSEIATSGVELRVVESLWPIRDAVIESTLCFSCIRMHHAAPRQ